MLKRIFSLKSKRSFAYILKNGHTFKTPHLIIKYAKPLEQEKLFGVITSSKFSKKAVIKTRARRLISEALTENFAVLPEGDYVVIPKKTLIDSNGKIAVNVKELGSEISALLSKMAVS